MAVQPVRIIGSFLSPYMREVLVALAVRGVACEIAPIVPFFGGDEFSPRYGGSQFSSTSRLRCATRQSIASSLGSCTPHRHSCRQGRPTVPERDGSRSTPTRASATC